MADTYSRGYAMALTLEPTIDRDIVQAPTPEETQTAAAQLTEDVGFGRSRARTLNEAYTTLHEQSRMSEWRIRTSNVGKQEALSLLTDLADRGFAWRDVARIVGVSVPAVQKWRKGERCTSDNRHQLAALVAMCELLEEHYIVQDVSSWLEMPIKADIRLTPLDLFVARRPDLVLELGSGHADPEAVLTAFDPDWRDKYVARYEAYVADDGAVAIRPLDR